MKLINADNLRGMKFNMDFRNVREKENKKLNLWQFIGKIIQLFVVNE